MFKKYAESAGCRQPKNNKQMAYMHICKSPPILRNGGNTFPLLPLTPNSPTMMPQERTSNLFRSGQRYQCAMAKIETTPGEVELAWGRFPLS